MANGVEVQLKGLLREKARIEALLAADPSWQAYLRQIEAFRAHSQAEPTDDIALTEEVMTALESNRLFQARCRLVDAIGMLEELLAQPGTYEPPPYEQPTNRKSPTPSTPSDDGEAVSPPPADAATETASTPAVADDEAVQPEPPAPEVMSEPPAPAPEPVALSEPESEPESEQEQEPLPAVSPAADVAMLLPLLARAGAGSLLAPISNPPTNDIVEQADNDTEEFRQSEDEEIQETEEPHEIEGLPIEEIAAAVTVASVPESQDAAPAPIEVTLLEPNVAPGPDDLTLIRGLTPDDAAVLEDLGVTTFAAIATWTGPEVKALAKTHGFGRRIAREGWIEQAAMLVRRGRTSHTDQLPFIAEFAIVPAPADAAWQRRPLPVPTAPPLEIVRDEPAPVPVGDLAPPDEIPVAPPDHPPAANDDDVDVAMPLPASSRDSEPEDLPEPPQEQLDEPVAPADADDHDEVVAVPTDALLEEHASTLDVGDADAASDPAIGTHEAPADVAPEQVIDDEVTDVRIIDEQVNALVNELIEDLVYPPTNQAEAATPDADGDDSEEEVPATAEPPVDPEPVAAAPPDDDPPPAPTHANDDDRLTEADDATDDTAAVPTAVAHLSVPANSNVADDEPGGADTAEATPGNGNDHQRERENLALNARIARLEQTISTIVMPDLRRPPPNLVEQRALQAPPKRPAAGNDTAASEQPAPPAEQKGPVSQNTPPSAELSETPAPELLPEPIEPPAVALRSEPIPPRALIGPPQSVDPEDHVDPVDQIPWQTADPVNAVAPADSADTIETVVASDIVDPTDRTDGFTNDDKVALDAADNPGDSIAPGDRTELVALEPEPQTFPDVEEADVQIIAGPSTPRPTLPPVAPGVGNPLRYGTSDLGNDDFDPEFDRPAAAGDQTTLEALTRHALMREEASVEIVRPAKSDRTAAPRERLAPPPARALLQKPDIAQPPPAKATPPNRPTPATPSPRDDTRRQPAAPAAAPNAAAPRQPEPAPTPPRPPAPAPVKRPPPRHKRFLAALTGEKEDD